MISAGSITVKCGDANDRSTRLVAERLVARFASRHYRIFKASSGLQSKKRVLLDAYVKKPGDKGTLIKIMRGVRWNQLSKNFTAYFMRDFSASSAGKFIAMKYNRRSLNKHLVRPVWRQVFKNRPKTRQCLANPSGTVSIPTPLPRPRPVDKQSARQNALVAAVRSVYGASKSEAYAKTVLKTQSWSTLKDLGIASRIMKAFKSLGYRRAGRSGRAAQRLLKKTLKNWKTSSGATQPAPARPVVPTPPHRPVTRPVAPTPRPASKQPALQQALVSAVRKVYGASKSESYVKTVLKTQSWNTLKQLGIASDIQRAFGKLGFAKAARNSSYAQRLVKKTLKNWI